MVYCGRPSKACHECRTRRTKVSCFKLVKDTRVLHYMLCCGVWLTAGSVIPRRQAAVNVAVRGEIAGAISIQHHPCFAVRTGSSKTSSTTHLPAHSARSFPLRVGFQRHTLSRLPCRRAQTSKQHGEGRFLALLSSSPYYLKRIIRSFKLLKQV
jgi:hypothetical protein